MPTPPAVPHPSDLRSDGVQARSRILHAALGLFAAHGFSRTSTRDIALAAGANLAAIRYYFGDKAGLYHAVFTEPLGDPAKRIARFAHPQLDLGAALQGFYAAFLEPMKESETLQQCMRLHFRELLDPTGLFAQEMNCSIKPEHAALLGVLQRHLGLARADADLHRLAFALVGMAMQLFVGRDVILALQPALLRSSAAIDAWAARMAGFGVALVQAEATRRAAAPTGPARKARAGTADAAPRRRSRPRAAAPAGVARP